MDFNVLKIYCGFVKNICVQRGECRWEKDGTPVGMYENKYEWHGSVAEGDCSLRVREANIEYDNGVWQCQVTASDFTQRDTLISEGAELVVRGEQSRCGKLLILYFVPQNYASQYRSHRNHIHLIPATWVFSALLPKN